MTDCLAMLRMMNLYYHHLHNIAHGVSFHGDHKIMNKFYIQLDTSYDMLIERYIGLEGECSKGHLFKIVNDAYSVLESIPDVSDMDTHFYHAINLESLLRAELESAAEEASKGTQNLLEQLMDESEARVYKLRQRVK